MGNIFAFMTADAVDHHGEDDYTERHGWIDPSWSRTTLFESRNDVEPLLNMSEQDPELWERVRDIVDSHAEDNGDGTFYGVDECQDFATGTVWTYAIHFKRKFYGTTGWTEEAWHPTADAGVPLGDFDESSELFARGVDHGWGAANYANAYGGDIRPSRDQSPDSDDYRAGFWTGAQRFHDDEWQDGTPMDE